MKKNVHIIPHSHWDREWYFNTSRSTIYLIKHFKEVISYLEENSEFTSFLMDAQSSLVEDYLKFCPEDYMRIKKLVKEKRLFVGPWYTQTDQLVVSQESIVRNLYYGSRYANKLGGYFNVAYAPDIFGQAGNMPQIYKEFGMNYFLFWRGVSDNTSRKTEMIWTGDDGTKIFSKQIRDGYYYGGFLPENEEDIKVFLDEKIKHLENISNSDIIYFPNGFDQAPIRKNLVELKNKFNKLDKTRNYIISTPEKYFEELEKNIDYKKLVEVKGELTEAKHSRIHKSIFSSRADIKIINNKNENKIVNVLEPLLCISHKLGNRYPEKELEKIWKLMFENAAHDSIGCCNSDSTNKDILYRHKVVSDYADNLLELNMRLITDKIKTDKEIHFTLFNTYPETRSEIVEMKAYITDDNFQIKDYDGNILDYVISEKIDQTEYVLNQTQKLNLSKKIYMPNKVYLAKILVYVENLPSLGYKSIYFDFNSSKQIEYSKEKSNVIENEYYKVRLNDKNSFDILDKINMREYFNQIVLQNNGDDGDSYNYSPLRNEKIIYSDEAEIIDLKTYKSDVSQKMEIKFKIRLPYNLEKRSKNIRDTDYYYKIIIELRKNEKIIRADFEFENNVLSHRFCAVFDTEISSNMSVADQVFGMIERKVELDTLKVWEKENWQEIPNSIEPMQSFVTLNSKKGNLAIITDCVREYEIIGDKKSKICVTLFRTYSYMGKENLLYRPNRASGETIIETPDAELQKVIKCRLAIYSYQGDFDDFNISKISKFYLTPIISYQKADFLNGRMIFCYRDENKEYDTSFSMYNIKTDAIISCFKKKENSNKYVMRVFNPFLNKSIKMEIKNGKCVKLDEKTKVKENKILTRCKYQTYLLEI